MLRLASPSHPQWVAFEVEKEAPQLVRALAQSGLEMDELVELVKRGAPLFPDPFLIASRAEAYREPLSAWALVATEMRAVMQMHALLQAKDRAGLTKFWHTAEAGRSSPVA